MTVGAVLFDLFETLVYYRPTDTRIETLRVAAEAGIPEERWVPGWRAAGGLATRGEITSLEDRVRRALAIAGVPAPDERLVRSLVDLYRQQVAEAPCAYRDVEESLTTLRQHGLRLGLISNIHPYETEIVDRLGLTKLFDAMALSCQLGICKPDPRIYLRVTQQLSVSPKECAFVGDGMNDELAAARDLGMRAVQIERGRFAGDDERYQVCDARVRTLGELVAYCLQAEAP